MYSKWLSFCQFFHLYSNVVWFEMLLRGFNVTQKRRVNRESPWNIPDLIGIFAKRLPHAITCVFHWFLDLPMSFIILLLISRSSVVLDIHECGIES